MTKEQIEALALEAYPAINDWDEVDEKYVDKNEYYRSKAIRLLKKASELMYSEEDMIRASKYGYEFRDTTSFPEHKFEDSCINNTKQWLQSLKQQG